MERLTPHAEGDATNSKLEFEPASHVKISKPFKTPAGHSISVLRLNKNRALITSKQDKDLSFTVIGPVDELTSSSTAKFSASEIWDKVKEFVGGLLGGGDDSGGGGGGCNQTTGNVEVHVTVSGGGGSISISPNAIKVDVQCQKPE